MIVSFILLVIIIIALSVVVYYNKQEISQRLRETVHVSDDNANLRLQIERCHKSIDDLQQQLEAEAQRNNVVVSQSKSSQTRLGQIAENLAPFLDEFPYDPKFCHFMGMPIDFLVFNYTENEIVFLEIKTGGAKESSRQKHIKNIIKSGKVRYEQLRINAQGVKVK